MPKKRNFKNEELNLDPITVNSYGETFRKMNKTIHKRRPFRDPVTIIAASEMKLQILKTEQDQEQKKQKTIFPQVDIRQNMTSPGIKLGHNLKKLFELCPPSQTASGPSLFSKTPPPFVMLPPSRQTTEGAAFGLFGKNLSSSRSDGTKPNTPVFGEQEEEEIRDERDEEYFKECIPSDYIKYQNSPLSEIRTLSSPSSGSDWSPGVIEINEGKYERSRLRESTNLRADGFHSIGDIT